MTHYWRLLRYKVYAELRAEAARTYIGVAWWLLEPLLYMSVFYVIFGIVFERGGPDFAPFLLSGLVVWKWFDSGFRQGANAIPANAGLIRQVYLPKSIFPTIAIVVSTTKFLLVLGLLLGFLLLWGYPLTPAWLALPALLVVQFLLIVACAWVAAAVMPLLPDLRVLIDNGLMLMFFLSGIFFDIGHAPEQLQQILGLNPMAALIQGYRQVLLQGVWPDWGMLAWVAGGSLLFIGVGARLMARWDGRYVKVLLS